MHKLPKILIAVFAVSCLLAAANKSTTDALDTYEKQYGALMNNVVNVNTPGYRAVKIVTRLDKAGNLVAEESSLFFRNGAMTFSGDPLHVAIDGPGFFSVRTPQGDMFTRDGRFTVDNDGELVTLSGRYPVLAAGGSTIQLGMENIDVQITETGLIVRDGEMIDRLAVGELDPSVTLRTVNGAFFEAPGSDNAFINLETPRVRQYYYESSNVDMSEELVAMPDISKKYDANAKVLQIMKKITTTGREMGSAQ
ncbi:putative flagellar basal-body rod protein [Candidatus Termititenax aidoneus]|uniref:Flagellar basal-body rod protein n=1 Tax=Termititenax aidoneus TaxID=2218524 RepID=A0A388TBE9_TERA1|nr:putative flagellar basal-body rod protein [Candidatus Termititenax aidoneus]